MNKVAHMQEWSRRILATRLAPRVPRGNEGPYRDLNGIRWLMTKAGWVLDFTDVATRAELLRRLPGAVVSASGSTYFGTWRGQTTSPVGTWADAIVMLYETYEPQRGAV